MSKQKMGKSIDDIFSKKQPEKESIELTSVTHKEDSLPKEKQGRGRPQEHKEGWTKVTVVLLDKQIHWLDKLALDIRHNTKAAISRAEIIRSMISAMDECGIDLTKSKSEEELKALILTAMGKDV